MYMKEITHESICLARLISTDSGIEKGLMFLSQDSDYQQVGFWNYDSGVQLKAHVHNAVPRMVLFTQEVIFVLKGLLRARIYTENGSHVEDLTVRRGDILVLLSGGHGYDILEDNTEVLEIKNGPYLGAEVDRRRLQS